LIATISDFFSDISNKKIPYKVSVLSLSVISGMISVIGVDEIIRVAVPILVIIYPVAIVLMIFILTDEYIKQSIVYKCVLSVTLLISFFQGLSQIGLLTRTLNYVLDILPLNDIGFPWLMPAILTFAISFSSVKIFEKRRISNGKSVAEVLYK
jgi:branched-chain amino acid:cation transporter, LIVCS family